MITVSGVSKSFPTREILREVSWQVVPGERVGLVGPNGAGKTTFLRILTGEVDADKGEVQHSHRLQIGILPQEQVFNFEGSLNDAMWEVFTEIRSLQDKLDRVAEKLTTETDSDTLHHLIEEQSELQLAFELAGGYTAESRIGRVLYGLGFKETDRKRPVSEFSGGWQMRVALARLLLRSPDLLLLDEPTNHLDVAAIEWLEDYLSEYPGAVVTVSHDRMFMDQVVNRISELAHATFTEYSGTYSDYVEEKARREEIAEASFERQQKEIARQRAFIERFRYSATRSTQAKSRERQLSKLERIQLPRPIPRVDFRFPEAPQSGHLVLRLAKLGKAYDHVVFKDLSLELRRGDRLALVGPNGCGKSTLMRLIAGDETPTMGQIEHGHNVKPGYYSQAQAEKLDGTSTVLDAIYQEAPNWTLEEARNLLARFLFRGDDVYKRVAQLSGGEKSRLAIAKLLLRPINLLLLDEPTNHLDIGSRDTLAAAIAEFEGSVVLVSHDRYLIDQISNRVLAFEDVPRLYEGDYANYRTVQEEKKVKKPAPPKPAPAPKKADPQKLLNEAEAAVLELEERVSQLEAQLGDPSLYAENPDQVAELQQHYQSAQAELEAANQRWMELVEGL